MSSIASAQIDGQVFFYPPNTPRIIPGEGILIEPSSTNLVLESQGAFSNATYWTNTGAGLTVTDNTVASPDSSNTASTLAWATGSTATLSQSITLGATDVYVDSIWLKGAVGGEIVNLIVYDSTGTVQISSTPLTLTSSWARYDNIAWNGTSAHAVLFELSNGASAQTVYCWGAQREAHFTIPSSYIPTTTTTATRSVEYISPPSYMVNPAIGSISFDAKLLTLPGGNTISLFFFNSPNGLEAFWDGNTTVSVWSYGVGNIGTMSGLTADLAWHHYGFSWIQNGTNATISSYFDRVLKTTQTTATTLTSGTIQIGVSGNGTGFGAAANSMFGYIKNVKISTDLLAGL